MILVEVKENIKLRISIIKEKKKDLKYKTFICLNLIIVNNHNVNINILMEIKSNLKFPSIIIKLLVFNIMTIIIIITIALIKETLNGANIKIEDSSNNFIISKRKIFIIYSIKIVLFIRHLTNLKLYLRFFE